MRTRRCTPLSDFSPLRGLLEQDPQAAALLGDKNLRFDHVPDRWVNTAGQLLQRWSYAGEGVDLDLYVASVLDRQGVAQLPSPAEFARRMRVPAILPVPNRPLLDGPLLELPMPDYGPLPFPFHPSYSLLLGQRYFTWGLRRHLR